MSRLQNLRENLCEELEKMAKKEEINTDDLEIIDKLTHSIKNLDKVMLGDEMVEEYGYSFGEGYSGARRGGRGGRGGRRGRDGDSDGRYSEDSYEGSSREGRSYAQSYAQGRSNEGRSYENSYGNSMGSYERGRSNEGSYSGHYDESIDRFKHIMQDAMHKL